MPEVLERIAKLEAIQDAHEKRLDSGAEKFSLLFDQNTEIKERTARIETMLVEHCRNSGHGCNGKRNPPSKAKEVVVRFGPAAGGGLSILALICLLIERALGG